MGISKSEMPHASLANAIKKCFVKAVHLRRVEHHLGETGTK